MPIPAGDRQKLPIAFWGALRKFGIEPASVLRHAHLPLTLSTEDHLVTTAQFFAIWRAVGDLSHDPGVGLKMGSLVAMSPLPLPMLAAHHARDYRDALTRHARFRQLYSSGEMHLRERKEECAIELRWPHTREEEPPVMTVPMPLVSPPCSRIERAAMARIFSRFRALCSSEYRMS